MGNDAFSSFGLTSARRLRYGYRRTTASLSKRSQTMRKATVFALALCLLVCAPWTSSGQQKDALRILMAEKLDKSKTILEGIALADFRKITTSSETLIQLSKTEEWFAFKTARYEQHTNEFRRAAENLADKAQHKNLDGVTLAYFDLTMSCVRCHQYVRDVRDARAPLPSDKVLASNKE
jgi:hypothetical protein